MALIKTVAEIRSVIPRLSKLSTDANLPNLEKAGRTRIVPFIGAALYDDLNVKYNGNDPLTANETALIKHIQLPLAAFALYDDLPFLHTSITDNGVRTANTEALPAAHRWEYKQLQEALASYAADGIEILLQYLYANKGNWSLWTESEAFREFNDCLIRTGSEFTKFYHLFQPQRSFWQLKPVMLDVEENYMASRIGRSLLALIKQQQSIVVSKDGEEVDVKKTLKKATAYLTIKLACEHVPVRFSESGFTVLATGGDMDHPESSGRQTAENLKAKIDAAHREGNSYLEKSASILTLMREGKYIGDIPDGFNEAFDKGPLYKAQDAESYTNGNERRKIYRF